ncbi:MAG: choice-of-anchor J domain-containing protein [Bacteroidales bacterium]|nr:choice-of-anchor J domain-containing protein [Bacteroidales bacterium]
MKKPLFFLLMMLTGLCLHGWAQNPNENVASIPYMCNFSNPMQNALWTIVDGNNDEHSFDFSSYANYAYYQYHSTNNADDWLISPGFQFTGSEYLIFDYRTASSSYYEKFQIVAIGADTIPITTVMEVNNTTSQTMSVDLSALHGLYRIGFHCVSLADQYTLYLTNVNVVTPPFLSFDKSSLDFGWGDIGSSSSAQRVIMYSFGNSDPITVTAPADFQVSLDTATFSSSLTFPANDSPLRKDTFYVRFTPMTGGLKNVQLVAASSTCQNHMMLHGVVHACNDTMSLPFKENFEETMIYCWTILDQDGDGYTWEQFQNSFDYQPGYTSIYSRSHYDDFNEQYYVQDNWLISQPVQISANAYLSYYVDSYSWTFSKYSVLVSTTGQNVSDFVPLFSDSVSNDNYTHRMISLADYAGQTVYLAFRNNSIQDCLIDDISIATLEDHPVVIVTPKYIHCGNLSVGYGEVKSFQVETFGPTGNLFVSGSSLSECSLDGINFYNAVILPSTGGTVYVRFTLINTGYKTEMVTIAAEHAATEKMMLYARGLQCYNTIPYTHNFNNSRNDCWQVMDANNDYYTFQLSAVNGYAYLTNYTGQDIDDWLISPLFDLDGNQFGYFDYWGVNSRGSGRLQVYAMNVFDTIPISPMVQVLGAKHKRLYFDLSTLQGTYHLAIRDVSENTNANGFLYLTNFNVLNLSPLLAVNPDTLDFGSRFLEELYVDSPVEVMSVDINAPVNVSVQAPFEISLDGVNYSTTVTIPSNSAGVQYDTVLVRMMAPTAGNFAGWMTVSTTGFMDSVYLTGTVPECHNTIPYTYSFTSSEWNECWTVINGNNDNRTFTLDTANAYARYYYNYAQAADDWLISPYFNFDGHQYGSIDYRVGSSSYLERFEVYALGADTILLTSVMEVSNTTYQTLYWENISSLHGNYRIAIHCVSAQNMLYLYLRNFHINTFPEVMFTSESLSFSLTNVGNSSDAQQVVFKAVGTTMPITVTAPTHFEVSLDGVNFSAQCTIPAPSDFTAQDTLQVRFTPLDRGTLTGQLVVSSGSVIDTMLLSGEGRNCNDTLQLPFKESFEETFTHCWSILDEDGHGTSWIQYNSNYYAHSGSKSMFSQNQYDNYNEEDIPQDNWLISQPIYLSDTAFLSFYSQSYQWLSLNKNVYISTSGNSPSDFTLLLSDTVEIGNYYHQTIIPLADYVGQTVRIAFRSFHGSDWILDDVTIATLEQQPLLSVSPHYIATGSVALGYGEVRPVQVKRFGSVGNITVSGTTLCDVSLDGVNFASTVTMPSDAGTFYIRFTPTNTIYRTEVVTVTADFADAQTVTLYGKGAECFTSIPYIHNFNNSRNECWSVVDGNNDNSSFYLYSYNGYVDIYTSSGNTIDDWLISPFFDLDGNQYGFFDYWGAYYNLGSGRIQVYAMNATDTILVSQAVQVPSSSEHKQLYFDLSSLQGTYHVGIRDVSNTLTHSEHLLISNFNIQNLAPMMVVNPDTIDFGSTLLEDTPSATAIEVMTVGNQAPISITVPAPFAISLDGVNYSTSLTLPATNVNVRYDTVLVRMSPTTTGIFTGWLTVTSSGLSDNVYLTGRVPECHNVIPYTYSFASTEWNECWTIINANNDFTTFTMDTVNSYAQYTYNYSEMADDWLVSPYFQFDGNQYGSVEYRSLSSYYTERFEVYAMGADTILLTPAMVVANTSYQTLAWNLSALQGTYRIAFHCISDANAYNLYFRNFNILPQSPGITLNQDTLDFGMTTINAPTAPQQVIANLESIFTPVTIVSPLHFEVSADGITFAPSITLPAKSDVFAADTFYVRFNPTIAGTYAASLTVADGTVENQITLIGDAYDCNLPTALPIVEDFEDALSPCWQTIDVDNDGHNWMPLSVDYAALSGHESSDAYVSSSWLAGALNPNDWLITPAFVPTDHTILSFFVQGSYGVEHFAVYVSTTPTYSSFMSTTPVFTGTSTTNWDRYITYLSDYAGDTVYVGFRHYNSYNQYHLKIDDILITDSMEQPVLMMNPESLSFGNVGTGESATKSVVIEGYGFNSGMIASTTSPYSISMDGVNFSNIILVPATGGTMYVRFNPTIEGVQTGTITINPIGISTVTIPLQGIGVDCQNTIPYTYLFDELNSYCWTIEDANQDNYTFNVNDNEGYAYYSYNTSQAADDWIISPVFSFNGNQYGYFDYYVRMANYSERFEVFALGADTIRLTLPLEVNNEEEQRLIMDLTSLIGSYRIGIHCISNQNMYTFFIKNFNLKNISPTILSDVDTLDFGLTAINSYSDPQQVLLTSIGIYAPITVTVPAQYEVSWDNVNYGTSLTLPYHTSLIEYDTLYVRYAPTAVGQHNGLLTLSFLNQQHTIALTGSARDCDVEASVPFEENFEGYNNYCWTILDADGDGYIWMHDNNANYAHSGEGYFLSESYANTTLCPDNWLISQPIHLPETPAMLSFWVRSFSNTYEDEHYSVYVSTTGNSIQDFTHEVFTSVSTYDYQQKLISLRDYVGQTVYIAFRHHNSCDQYKLIVDDIAIQLDTTPQLPLVATDSVMAVTQLSAAGVGHLVFDGNTDVTDRGFCWSTAPEPTLADSHISSPTPSQSFMGMLIGLSEHTTYYLRAYATNSFGTVYGESVVFTTLCGPATQTSFTQTACESFEWNGITYTQTGDYVQNLQNIIGCDSIVTLHLTIYHGDSTEFAHTDCDSYTWAGTTYTQSGDYTKTFATVHGCDSVVTLHLTIHQSAATEFTAETCDSYVWDDSTFTVSGDYVRTYPTVHGCDSVVTLHLTIHQSAATEFTAETCDSYVWDDSTFTVSGDYVRTYPTVYGCDSVVTLHLTIYPSVTNEVLVSCPDSCYEWNGQLYCVSGDYIQVLQTVHGCDSTVLMHLTITVGIEDPVVDRNLQVYPNPTNGLLSIRGTSFSQVLLFDAYGKRIGVWNAEGDVTQIDLSSYAPGVYFVKVMDKQQIVGVKKVIKQ